MHSLEHKRRLNVLAVEDSEDDFELCICQLQKEFNPYAKRIDTTAELRASLAEEQWDVILCDYNMPDFSALEALQIVRTSGKDIPFIVVSGSMSEEEAVRCIKAGAHDYLIKDRLLKLPHAVKREMSEANAREEHRKQETLTQELYKELQNFRTALNVSSLVSVTDTEGRILEINDLFIAVSGYEEKELIGANHHVISSGYHSKEFWSDFWATILRGTVGHGDIKNRAKDGSEYWVDMTIYPLSSSDGTVYRFMSISHVITEKKKAEMSIAESELRFRTLADSAPVLVWMSGIDKKNFYFNKTWLDFTGKLIEQEMHDGWLDGVHPADTVEYMNTYITAFDKQKPFSMEYRLRHCSAEYRWLLDNGVPRYLPDGTFAGYMGSCVDITTQKQAEQYLQEVNEDLEARISERTKALVRLNQEKNEFLGIAAHDLKNPLAGIRGSAEIVHRYYEPNVKAAEFVRRIIESCDQMLDIITNLLDVNKIEDGGYTLNLTSVPLELLSNIVQEYQIRAAQKGIILFYEPHNVNVLADRQAFQQIFDNLVSNAVKYSPQWSKVWVRSVLHTTVQDEARVRIEVQDEGPGLTEQDKAKLFTKFARLSAKPTAQESSTGLGLSIVKRLVEAMNGNVWCESEYGKGATFIVELPMRY
jgi:PAS domain S-box-containing protein